MEKLPTSCECIGGDGEQLRGWSGIDRTSQQVDLYLHDGRRRSRSIRIAMGTMRAHVVMDQSVRDGWRATSGAKLLVPLPLISSPTGRSVVHEQQSWHHGT